MSNVLFSDNLSAWERYENKRNELGMCLESPLFEFVFIFLCQVKSLSNKEDISHGRVRRQVSKGRTRAGGHQEALRPGGRCGGSQEETEGCC